MLAEHSTRKMGSLTLPSWLAVALVAEVVRCVCAEGAVGAGIWRAGREHLSAGGPTVGRFTQTGETGHTVHTRALIQAGAGPTFVNVHLTQVT